jgi:hypothetical protein
MSTLGDTGKMAVTTGKASQGNSGGAFMTTGDTFYGVTGAVELATGSATSGQAGDIKLTVGSTDTGIGGAVSMTAGFSSQGLGGEVKVVAGTTLSGTGGLVSIFAGDTKSSGSTGGAVVIEAGAATTDTDAGVVNVGLEVASKVEIGKRDNSVMTRVNGLAEAHTLKVGEHAQSGTMNKRLKLTTPEVQPPALYPSAIWSFDVYVPGAVYNDIVAVSFSRYLGSVTGRVTLTGQVIAADTVRVLLSNPGHNERIETIVTGAYDITCTHFD